MALTERFENDKIEVVGTYKAVQVAQALSLGVIDKAADRPEPETPE
jgi:hypothetical protein